MDKRLIFPGNPDRARDTFFVREDRNYLRKHASSYHPKIASYIEKAEPVENLIQILMTALSAYPYFPQNVNGDRFRDASLAHDGDDYGHRTFVTNGNYFNHHINRDPALAKGKILHSVWNERAHRVELVIGIDPGLDPDASGMIDRGEMLCGSMGCKVPYDICTVCANRAKTRMDYCDHLRYMMNQFDSGTGIFVGADNTLPKFFDYSRVLIPADKTAYMWTKIASAAGPYNRLSSAFLADLPPGKLTDHKYLQEKVAEMDDYLKTATRKSAMITKRIPLETPKVIKTMDKVIPPAKELLQATSPDLDVEKLKASAPSLEHLLSTLLSLAIELKESEAAKLIDSKHTPETLGSLILGPSLYHPPTAELLMGSMPDRSFHRPFLLRRITILARDMDKPEIQKHAQSIGELMREEVQPKKEQLHPGFVVGLLAALYALMGPHAQGLGGWMGKLVSNHPFLATALGSGALATYRSLQTPANSGTYSVDDPTRGFYNNDWQSRFARLQARPVTVIKTGAAVDKELNWKVWGATPAIWLSSHIAKLHQDTHPDSQPGLASRIYANNPELLTAGLIGEHLSGRPISSRIEKLIKGAKRFKKHASIRDPDFLSEVPESEQEWVWDLAILDAANQIENRITGG